MRSSKRRLSPSTIVLVGLLCLACAGLFAPRRWTGGLISAVQVLVPFQAAANEAATLVAPGDSGDQASVSAETLQALQRVKSSYEHQVASLSMRVANLEEEVRVLAATRLWGDVDSRLGSRGRLIPAQVVSGDLLPWRDSRLINAGTLQGVRSEAAVTSHHFSIDLGAADGVQSGMAILRSEVLIGVIREAGTHTARVQLLSDVDYEGKVRIARQAEGRFEPVDGFFWLSGRGGGRMEIRNVLARDVEAGKIAVGDLVLSDHTDVALPASLVIGHIEAIDVDRHNPLLSIITVRNAVDETSLRRVYVFDPEPEEPQ